MRRVGEAEPPILVFEGVVKRYGSVLALDGVGFHVNRGEVVCLIGPSGSGESTLLRCANGLEAVDGGRVVFEGIDLVDPRTNLVQVRRRIGMVFQHFELFPHMTTLRNVTTGLTIVLKVPRPDAAARRRALLAKVGLADTAEKHPAELSGGQQQRMVVVTHEMDFAKRVADWVVVFDRARVLEQGPPAQIFEQPTVARTREFLSDLDWHADADEPGNGRAERLAAGDRGT